jgi:tetrahydromethanopterin S-methyltransferase subunit G
MMADKIENLMLEHLKRFQATLDRVENKMTELTGRVANLEGGQAAIISHLGHLASADAAQQLSTDHVNERLDRIERRLELTN